MTHPLRRQAVRLRGAPQGLFERDPGSHLGCHELDKLRELRLEAPAYAASDAAHTPGGLGQDQAEEPQCALAPQDVPGAFQNFDRIDHRIPPYGLFDSRWMPYPGLPALYPRLRKPIRPAPLPGLRSRQRASHTQHRAAIPTCQDIIPSRRAPSKPAPSRIWCNWLSPQLLPIKLLKMVNQRLCSCSKGSHSAPPSSSPSCLATTPAKLPLLGRHHNPNGEQRHWRQPPYHFPGLARLRSRAPARQSQSDLGGKTLSRREIYPERGFSQQDR